MCPFCVHMLPTAPAGCEPGRGAHTGCHGGVLTTLGPEHSAPPNSLMAVMGPSRVGSSCGVRVGWGGVLPGALWGQLGTPRSASLRPTFQKPQSPLFNGDR